VTFVSYKQQVGQLLHRGWPFSEVEAWIDRTPLSEDEQCALWLFAWSLTDLATVKPGADASRSISCSTTTSADLGVTTC
jgi:hypothetical protein